MRTVFIYSLLCLLVTINISACSEKPAPVEKKVERPVEYDEYGNEVLMTADGEREVSDSGCD